MSSIKNKLNIYNQKPTPQKTQKKPPKNKPTTPESPKTLTFGPHKFTQTTPGVYIHHQTHTPQLRYGTKTLKNYHPFALSGILELALSAQAEALHPEDILILDTETTGLSRASGTLPFLTGCAHFQKNNLHLELIYLHDPGDEEAYLEYLCQKFARFPYLVTYNGKSFDIPVLRNRMIMNRKKGVFPGVHFDMLHILRRLFPKKSLPGYRQSDLEKTMLDHVRFDDLPGALVPQIYFDYKKYNHDNGMARIFEHNLLDIQGLTFLFLEAIQVYANRATAGGALRSGIARILARNRKRHEAIALLDNAKYKRDASESEWKYRDLLFLAGLYRSEKKWEHAAQLYARTAEQYQCAYARLSLAKILEHRTKDLSAALEQVELLLASSAQDINRRELKKRKLRIQKKLEKQTEATP